MTIKVESNSICIVGNAPVEDAELLLGALQANPACTVDLSGAGRLHTAVVQLLIAVRPRLCGSPSDPFFSMHVLPALDPGNGSA